ncbi:DUF3352 domain-containing protein [Chloroflexus aggregans]|uniref:DUF3352 domain-containing protein n=1 Tax=Chloroflexus aggregans (strain MD-66 / DSM 9485) TaxID=326427 RepID=B8GAE8_CHLAD|nr:DUF3352 domain-containing protein [Chloroflexus aggregans]ACL26523.1 conserved hypothetical protein [Chloroflexus aggregans DSM 9485]
MTTPDPFSLPPVSSTEPRRSPLFLIIGGLVIGGLLIIVGGGALVWSMINQRGSAIPELLPAETQIYAAITPNLSDLPNIDRLRRAFPETFDYQNTDQTSDFLQERFGVTFADDIAPWIGAEVAVAVYGLPIEQLSAVVGELSNPFNPPATLNPLEDADLRNTNVLLIVAVRDQRAAQAFLDKQRTFREAQGERFTNSTTNGVTIYESESDETAFAAFALARNMVVFANNATSISTLIEQRSETALARSAQFQAVSQRLPTDRIGTIYLAGDGLARFIDSLFASGSLDETVPMLADMQSAAQAMQGVGFTMAVIESGLRFDAVTVFDRNRLSNALREQLGSLRPTVSPERAGDVSSTAIGVFSFGIPADWGQRLRDQLEAEPETANALRDLEDSLNISLDRDLFSWFHGEGVIALLPIDSVELPVGGYFALRVADRSAAERGMQRLIELAEDLTGIRTGTTSLGRTQVQAFEEGDLFFGYGFNGNDLVIAVGRPAMEAAFGVEQKLSSVATYANALKAMPSPNGGVLYINLTAARRWFNQTNDPIDPELEQRLAPFTAITSSGTVGIDDRGVMRGTLLLSIEPQ